MDDRREGKERGTRSVAEATTVRPSWQNGAEAADPDPEEETTKDGEREEVVVVRIVDD
jgi:hypothetical protein